MVHNKRRMGFPGRLEIAVYAEMYFQSAVLKLATAPGSQMWWFLQFRYSEQPLLKFAGFFLSTFRHSQLNVVQGFNPHGLPSYSSIPRYRQYSRRDAFASLPRWEQTCLIERGRSGNS